MNDQATPRVFQAPLAHNLDASLALAEALEAAGMNPDLLNFIVTTPVAAQFLVGKGFLLMDEMKESNGSTAVREILNSDFTILDPSIQLLDFLAQMGLRTIDDVVNWNFMQPVHLQGINNSLVNELEDKLKVYGLTLRVPTAQSTPKS